jgi:hypothetical protein
MKTIQKIGFYMFPIVFILLGIIFIIVGSVHDDRVLQIMGYYWLPAGIFVFILIAVLIKKKKY